MAVYFDGKKVSISTGLVEVVGPGSDPILQEKSVEITENTTTTYTADEGFDGLKSLEVTTNVAGSGGGGSDNFKALVEDTMTELTAEDLSGVTNIKNYLFYDSNIEKATIPSSVQTIGKNAFSVSKLKEVVFNDGLKSIGSSAFAGNSTPIRLLENQTSLILPSTLETIGNSAFQYADLSKVSEIVIPDSVTSIGSYMFGNCIINDCTITFGSGITELPSNLFRYLANDKGTVDYSSYRYLIFRGDITAIYSNACGNVKAARLFDFRNCTSVPTLYNTDGITDVTSARWYFTIVVPDELYDEWKTATNWSTFATRIKKASEYTG